MNISTRVKTLEVAKEFVDFLNKAVSPFHAVEECKSRLNAAGFQEIQEIGQWDIQPMKKYFLTRNNSTIFAFAVGEKYRAGNGFSMVVAHTDSPSLRVKPISKIRDDKFLQVGVMTYGGGLWRTWFDRDLSLAGIVHYQKEDKLVKKLVNVQKPVLFIPNLAIHLTSDRKTFEMNNETHLRPIIASRFDDDLMNGDKSLDITKDHHKILIDALAEQIECAISNIIDVDLYLYDCQPASIGGFKDEFICGQRLDNLIGTYVSISGLIESSDDASLLDEEKIRFVACFDNEECGSRSAQGAASKITEHILRRLCLGGSPNAFEESIPKSMLLSFDQCHAYHPNYTDKYEANHKPAFHEGIIAKFHANQNYSTSSTTYAVLKKIALDNNIPLQKFVVRNDVPCGSTIGPLLSSSLGIPGIDVGGGQLAMHSIRELACTSSIKQGIDLCSAFLKSSPSTLH